METEPWKMGHQISHAKKKNGCYLANVGKARRQPVKHLSRGRQNSEFWKFGSFRFWPLTWRFKISAWRQTQLHTLQFTNIDFQTIRIQSTTAEPRETPHRNHQYHIETIPEPWNFHNLPHQPDLGQLPAGTQSGQAISTKPQEVGICAWEKHSDTPRQAK